MLRFCKHIGKTTFRFKCVRLNSSNNWWALELGGHWALRDAKVLRDRAGNQGISVLVLRQSESWEATESI